MVLQVKANTASQEPSEPAAPDSAGIWIGDPSDASFEPLDASAIQSSIRSATKVVFDPDSNRIGVARDGEISATGAASGKSGPASYPLLGILPPLYPEWLGDRGFQETHGVRFAYIGGAMARGIGSTRLVIELARMGAMGMFGSAGLSPEVIEAAIDEMSTALDPQGLPWGSNLIHSPNEPDLEEQIVDLYLRRGVKRVSASAFMGLTPAIVRYGCSGLRRADDGTVVRAHHIFAKISREEVARHFLSPAPKKILDQLVSEGKLSDSEAQIAATVPLSEDIIVESDSGGHTDNRPLNALFPAIMTLRDRLAKEYQYDRPIRLGAAGSLGTPASVAAAFSLGASFVLVGTVHQAAVESGVSDSSRELLAQAELADVAMTASADMFELGVKVQVLQRGTMMGVRGNQLYDLYRRYDSIDDIPSDQRTSIEKNIFRAPLEDIWSQTKAFFANTDPAQIDRAESNAKHKMALIFRWYIGNSSQWPIVGDDSRRIDYQLWCGPAMGAFNKWVEGSFLEATAQRTVQQIALNLLEGAAHVSRGQQMRSFGLSLTQDALNFVPRTLRV